MKKPPTTDREYAEQEIRGLLVVTGGYEFDCARIESGRDGWSHNAWIRERTSYDRFRYG